MTSYPRRQASVSPDGNECTQLLQFLAKNPSAALRVFKLTSPADEPTPSIYKGRRPRAINRVDFEPNFWPLHYTKVRVYCLPPNRSTTSLIQPDKAKNKDMSLNKEEMESKAKCVDDLGYFDFDAILPAVYWKNR